MLSKCAMQGFYVLVDYHAYPGDTTVSSGALVSDWQTLWRAITSLPAFASDLAGRVFLDLINEPDGINVRYLSQIWSMHVSSITSSQAVSRPPHLPHCRQ